MPPSNMIEVALIEWTPSGVRLLGRSSDPYLVELVRLKLVQTLTWAGFPKGLPTLGEDANPQEEETPPSGKPPRR